MGFESLLYDKADQAVLSVTRRLGIILDYDDWQDARQAAALGFWRGWQRKPGNEIYCLISARNEATKFIIRCLFGKNPFCVLVEPEHTAAPTPTSDRHSLPDDVLRELRELFLSARKNGGMRTHLVAARDVFIVNAIYRGWTNEGIANALDTVPDNVKKYRQKIRRILERSIPDAEADLQ